MITPTPVDREVTTLQLYGLLFKTMLLEKVGTYTKVYFTRDELNKIAVDGLSINVIEDEDGFTAWLDEATSDMIPGVVYDVVPDET